MMRSADFIADLGPGAGEHGGHVVATGTVADIEAHPDSLTGAYLSGRKVVPYPDEEEERRIVTRDAEPKPSIAKVADANTVRALRGAARAVHVSEAVSEYAVRVVRTTRDPQGAGARITPPGGSTRRLSP